MSFGAYDSDFTTRVKFVSHSMLVFSLDMSSDSVHILSSIAFSPSLIRVSHEFEVEGLGAYEQNIIMRDARVHFGISKRRGVWRVNQLARLHHERMPWGDNIGSLILS
jgi:hypothetical protein